MRELGGPIFGAVLLGICLVVGVRLAAGDAHASVAVAANKHGDIGLCDSHSDPGPAYDCAIERCVGHAGRSCQRLLYCDSKGGWMAFAGTKVNDRYFFELACGYDSQSLAEKTALEGCGKKGSGCRIVFSNYEDPAVLLSSPAGGEEEEDGCSLLREVFAARDPFPYRSWRESWTDPITGRNYPDACRITAADIAVTIDPQAMRDDLASFLVSEGWVGEPDYAFDDGEEFVFAMRNRVDAVCMIELRAERDLPIDIRCADMTPASEVNASPWRDGLTAEAGSWNALTEYTAEGGAPVCLAIANAADSFVLRVDPPDGPGGFAMLERLYVWSGEPLPEAQPGDYSLAIDDRVFSTEVRAEGPLDYFLTSDGNVIEAMREGREIALMRRGKAVAESSLDGFAALHDKVVRWCDAPVPYESVAEAERDPVAALDPNSGPGWYRVSDGPAPPTAYGIPSGYGDEVILCRAGETYLGVVQGIGMDMSCFAAVPTGQDIPSRPYDVIAGYPEDFVWEPARSGEPLPTGRTMAIDVGRVVAACRFGAHGAIWVGYTGHREPCRAMVQGESWDVDAFEVLTLMRPGETGTMAVLKPPAAAPVPRNTWSSRCDGSGCAVATDLPNGNFVNVSGFHSVATLIDRRYLRLGAIVAIEVDGDRQFRLDEISCPEGFPCRASVTDPSAAVRPDPNHPATRLIEAFKHGRKARVLVGDSSGAEIVAEFSLLGFTRAWREIPGN